MTLLVKTKILGLFVNILTANDKYSPLNKGKYWQPIQMQLYKKKKTFSEFFAWIMESRPNLKKKFEKKITLIADAFLKLKTVKDVVR